MMMLLLLLRLLLLLLVVLLFQLLLVLLFGTAVAVCPFLRPSPFGPLRELKQRPRSSPG